MRINKIISNLYYTILLLVPVGWVLNWYYYYQRFLSEGFNEIGLVISITLVIFASFLFGTSQYLKRKKSNMYILFFIGYIVLALYSINCTTAGQYWDQQKINQKTETEKIDKENNSYWIKRYEKKISEAEKEFDYLRDIESKSIKNLSNMYYYKNTGKTVEERKNELKQEIADYENELKKLTDENIVSAKNQDNIKMSKTLYLFYSNALNMKNGEEKIQIIFQIILSILIESIAQLAIFAFMKIKFYSSYKKTKPMPPVTKIYTPIKITQNELRHFAVIAWSGINKKQSKSITNKSTFMGIIKNICPEFTENKYKLILRKAVENKLIKREENKYFPGSDFIDQDIDQEFFYKEMCKILKFT